MSKVTREKRVKCPRDGWTITEKKLLFEALKTHGHNDLDILRQAVPAKSKKAIELYLKYYQKLAEDDLRSDEAGLEKDCNSHKSVLGVCIKNDAPICQWVDAFAENKSRNSALSMAFRLIAHLENHPTTDNPLGIDLKKMYLYLGQALQGNSPDVLNQETMKFITCSLIDLATKTKRCRSASDVEYIQGISRLFKDIPQTMINNGAYTEPIPKAASEIQVSSVYNPLGLSMEALKRYPDL